MSLLNVALVHPEIPQNTGNISRLCVGADAALHLVLPAGFSLDTGKVRRAGLDHWDDLELHLHQDLDNFLSACRGRRLILTTKRGGVSYAEFAYRPGDFLVFGAETRGLPSYLLERRDLPQVFIPMPGPVRSLNLSNAVAVIVYEALRQLRASGTEYPDIHPRALAPPPDRLFAEYWQLRPPREV